uniref:Uncharacterized protein n=1 Tax=Arundo donax TaxID=35708 RepID=A0A0A9B4T4_ARUDO
MKLWIKISLTLFSTWLYKIYTSGPRYMRDPPVNKPCGRS